MKKILRIDASARVAGSRSRELGDHVEARWREAFPGGSVRTRDLAADPIGQLGVDTITSFFSPEDALTDELRAAASLSDALIDDVQSVDTLLITTPMYNFGVPAALKAWIDQVVRMRKTVSYDGTTFTGLAHPERAIVCIAYGAGGFQEGGALRGANFVEPYLDFVLKFIGIKDVRSFSVEATSGDQANVELAMARAREEIDSLFAPMPA